MQTLKTCSIPDEYRTVCFKDLEEYLKVDDLLYGYSQLEQATIRKNLGIINLDLHVDSELNRFSENPIQNKSVYNALLKKVDVDSISNVAISGNYRDLVSKPLELPNPEILIIKDLNGKNFVYDGKESVIVNLPSKITDFSDYKEYVIDWTKVENMIPIKTISVNGKIVEADTCKNVNLVIPIKVSDLTNDLEFVLKTLLDSELASLEQKLSATETSDTLQIKQELSDFKESVNKTLVDLSNKIEQLGNRVTTLENK